MNVSVLILGACLATGQTHPRIVFQQSHPPKGALVVRSNEQTRAIILIHGLNLKWQNPAVLLADMSHWQSPGTPTVKLLASHADVFAVAYGQDAPPSQIADAPALVKAVARVRTAGYQRIILVGHSAGGLIARRFVEDHPKSGVTKVIQVCTPNSGCFLAKLKNFAVGNQRPFINALTPQARRMVLLQRRRRSIPAHVQFACIVGTRHGSSDGIVSCSSQWSADLQHQGVPAIGIPADHWNVMQHPRFVQVLIRLVTKDTPRLSQGRVMLLRRELLK